MGVQQWTQPFISVCPTVVVVNDVAIFAARPTNQYSRWAFGQWLDEPLKAPLGAKLVGLLDHTDDLPDVGLTLGLILNDDSQIAGTATQTRKTISHKKLLYLANSG
ncbi:MAG: hypothetical protein RJB14_2373 [Pseudomonadota bacterium]